MMNEKTVRILLVEDNPGDARLLRIFLAEAGSTTMELTHFGCMSDAASHLQGGEVDVVLLDLGLPDAQGLGAVRQVHAIAPGVAPVGLTRIGDENTAPPALEKRGQEHLLKRQIERQDLWLRVPRRD